VRVASEHATEYVVVEVLIRRKAQHDD
jgi:hypothetical protein